MASHGLLCFCPRCIGGTTSKKGGNRGHRNGKPKPTPKPSGSFNDRKEHDTKGKTRQGQRRK